MNLRESDVLCSLKKNPYLNQRTLARESGYSLGSINLSLRNLLKQGYIDTAMQLTDKAKHEFLINKPKKAIILAAGFGMRMVPINMEVPKGLIEVNGECLIERIINQLHEVGIREIGIVVGFMKESYEYLIDKFDVRLLVNPEYAIKNNLYSLKLALRYLDNAYIIPCDIWCENNPFREDELHSWYMVSDLVENQSEVRVNRKMELVHITSGLGGNAMIGICYLTRDDAMKVRKNINELCNKNENDDAFWEKGLYENGRMIVAARVVHSDTVMEINTYEQLREFDSHSRQLKTDAISTICEVFHTQSRNITNISVLKRGMTNRSFLFTCNAKRYIMRIPGDGTEFLINRKEEAAVYRAIEKEKLCDDIIYINPVNGYKITAYLDEARVCNPLNSNDVQRCMQKLRSFHNLKIKVSHEFDLFANIDFYETLWNGRKSAYRDYENTKEQVLSLKSYIFSQVKEKVLTHIDAVPDNFLFVGKKNQEDIRLIDWEYAGMQDPHVDIAMFCIYSFYNRSQIDKVIDYYFTEGCNPKVRIKIYCYIAVCGLLWSNWCEYKRTLGVEFGEYSLRQYRYAKEFYKIAREEMEKQSKGDE